MPHTKSAKKSLRQITKRNERNRVAKKAIVDNLSWTGLRPRAAWSRGGEVYVKFWVPQGPLALDTNFVRRVKDYGFQINDGGAAKTITDVRLYLADTLKITCSTACSATARVRYALDYIYDNPVFDPLYGAAGNLRDSDRTRVNIAGADYWLWNWAVAFDIAIDQLQPSVA